jgi:hypothetical protein
MSAHHTTLKRLTQLGLLLLLATSLSGCATTVGQEFRDIMKDIDADCRKDKQGPYYDNTIPNHTQDGRCDILSIKPADPLATEEGRFAYAIKLPAPHDKLKTEYSRMMTAGSYFKALCEKDAGEWVFKTVEGVEGVFQGRRIEAFPAAYSDLVFHTREYLEGLASEDTMVQPSQGRYNYFERPTEVNEGSKPYIRFYRGAVNLSKYKVGYPQVNNGRWSYVSYIVNSEQTDVLKSNYGYTSRQVADKDMLENGIVGSELIVYDRATNEVLAFRRSFVRYWPRSNSRYTKLVDSDGCRPGFTKVWPQFIEKALVPVNPAK